ncbi:DivIVA domain-containing protein [Streptococcus cuniculipharyngis]|uniref:Cell cycle protein GpsB n=1 Tax=Streptococcus cuniculipharyngis TaxID=1562651 RepID=A0A5C5SC29_9STRE|nr:DivIVA domain-containing protein [Streptococcus cuniculipharyngis]TWS98109.1 DivIVA domain-containing protein [Streptococcus cuniculipharyngis]
MAGIILSPKDIFEQEFKTVMRGFDKKEVDEFLDDVIKDYETFMAQIDALQAENQALKEQLQAAPLDKVAAEPSRARVSSETSYAGVTNPASSKTAYITSSQTATNFDILKRISRLEKEVFGKQIVE